MVATGQRFEELNPGITIRWEKRSLQAFADASMADLAAAFDLIVMDPPHTTLATDAATPIATWRPVEAARSLNRLYRDCHGAAERRCL